MPNWIRVAALDDCPPGSACELVVADRIIALFNVDGQLYAIDGICPHQGGPLAQGRLDAHTVTCPWHGWKFDISGNPSESDASPAAICYPVRASGSDILICLDSET